MLTGKPTPGKAIRNFCIDCVGSVAEVQNCMGEACIDGPCLFLPYRLARGRPSVKLIRRFCVYCMGGHPTMVKDCRSRGCFLKPFRMGKNPNVSSGRAASFSVK